MAIKVIIVIGILILFMVFGYSYNWYKWSRQMSSSYCAVGFDLVKREKDRGLRYFVIRIIATSNQYNSTTWNIGIDPIPGSFVIIE
jgi:hypothetical protein